jgi:hypothetical protein
MLPIVKLLFATFISVFVDCPSSDSSPPSPADVNNFHEVELFISYNLP